MLQARQGAERRNCARVRFNPATEEQHVRRSRAVGKSFILPVLSLLVLNLVLAANNPGHDSLYIEEQGNSTLTGRLNISDQLRVANLFYSSYLDILGNGSAPSNSRAEMYATSGNALYMNAPGNMYLLAGGGSMVYVGTSNVDLNVSRDLYAGGYLYERGQRVCLANGTGCPASALGGGNVTGTGTANKLPYWTSATQIGSLTGSNNGAIYYDGSGNVQSNTLPVASGGTGVTSSTGTGSVVLSAAPTLTGTVTVNGNLSMPSAFWIGNGASATGSIGVAVGSSATAGDQAVAVGRSASATGTGSLALGRSPTAAGMSGIALGESSSAAGNYSIALGMQASAPFNDSVAIGRSATTSAKGQLVIGSASYALNTTLIGTLNTSGAITQNGVAVCLANGTNCPGTSYQSSAAGWTNTSTTTSTLLTVGLGTTNPGANVELVRQGTYSDFYMTTYSSSQNWHRPYFQLRRARNTEGSPQAVNSGDELGGVAFQGRHASGWANAAEIYVLADGAPSGSEVPGMMHFMINNGSGERTWMTIRASGNLGIGTSAPTQRLDVNGSVNVSGTSAKLYVPELCLNGNCQTAWPSGADGTGGWTNDSTSTWTTLQAIVNSSSVSGSLIVQNQTGSAHLFVNGSSGYVGVGNTAPLAPLHIAGAVLVNNNKPYQGRKADGSIVNISYVDASAVYRYADTLYTNGWSIGNTAYPRIYGDSNSNYMTFSTGTEIMRLANNGVGIGTTLPSATLHLNSSNSSGSLLVQNTSGSTHLFVNGSSGFIGLGTTSPTASGSALQVNGVSVFQSGAGGIPAYFYGNGGTSYLSIAVSTTGTGLTSFQPGANHLNFTVAALGFKVSTGAASPVERLLITSSGLVGIGTTAPTQTLDVNGSVNVSGTSAKLYAPEICLAGSCQTSWPSSADGTGGWTNTSTTTITQLRTIVNSSSNTGSFIVQRQDGMVSLLVNGSSGTTSMVAMDITDGTDTYFSVSAGEMQFIPVGFSMSGPYATYVSLGLGSGQLDSGASGVDINFNDATSSSALLTVREANVEYMRVSGDGNLGIGTTAPAAKLHVQDGAVFFNGTTGTTPSYAGGPAFMWIPSKAALRAGNTSSAVPWSDANIGVGSIALGYNSQASGNYTIALRGVATGDYAAAIGGNAAGFGATAIGWGANASAAYSTAVGIGTTGNAGHAFGRESTAQQYGVVTGYQSVADGGWGDYAFAAGTNANATGNGAVAIGQAVRASASHAVTIGVGVNSTSPLVNTAPYTLGIGMNSTVPTLTISAASGSGMLSNVGIGTTSPTQRLDVNGSVNVSGTASTIYVGNSQVCLANGTNCPAANVPYQSSAAGWTNTSTTTSTALDANITNVLFVTGSSSDVGIGTSSTPGKLTVSNSGNQPALYVDQEYVGSASTATFYNNWFGSTLHIGGGSNYAVVLNSASNSGTLMLQTNSTTALSIDQNQNVGIGTAAPVSKLHVQDGSLLFNGTTGNTPTSGAGTRMMWVPSKYALRAGKVSGSQWNDAQIYVGSVGLGQDLSPDGNFTFYAGRNISGAADYVHYTVAFGDNHAINVADHSLVVGRGHTLAVASYAVVAGIGNTVGNNDVAFGGSNNNSGYYSSILGGYGNSINGNGNYAVIPGGWINTVTGANAMAFGYTNTADGNNSIALGTYTHAARNNTFVIGSGVSGPSRLRNDVQNSLMVGFDSTTPTLFINGSAVGIGTTAPTQKLNVNGSVNISGTSAKLYAPEICLAGSCQTSWPSSADGTGGWTNTSTTTSTSLNVSLTGNLTIGSGTSNQSLLFIRATPGTGSEVFNFGNAQMWSQFIIRDRSYTSMMYGARMGGLNTGQSGADSTMSWTNQVNNQLNLAYNVTLQSYYDLILGAGATERMRILSTGNVGINTTAPSEKLHVAGGNIVISRGNSYLVEDGANKVSVAYYDSGNSILRIADGLFNARYASLVYFGEPSVTGIILDNNANTMGLQTGGVNRIFLNGAGGVGIGTATPTQKLEVNGSANITGNLFYGGNLTGYGADLAEYVNGSGVEAGDVVILGADGVERTAIPYDTRVAGIISTRPSHIMGMGEGNVTLALAGRVPLKVTAEGGPIRPGDLLTTSSTPGHAMRCADRTMCAGALVGKAMEPMVSQNGMITALVVLG